MTHLTDGLRLALDQLEAMVASFRSRHPMPSWRQQHVWQDVEHELWQAGFQPEPVWPALETYRQEREAARSQLALSAATTSTRPEEV